ncbi:hypothetical protein NDU88_002100 [Pleurodeles waltl]|uniref:Uncharacterized protein n=1 Tax=Pleurodeles waltl TaxID=8319 RepID=A0AAV7UAB6_PLEWA|nr:hypothetical protein NDU88_002100 [Pleurodeles waltl]
MEPAELLVCDGCSCTRRDFSVCHADTENQCGALLGGPTTPVPASQLVLADSAPVAAGDLLGAVVRGGFLEGEMDAAVVSPWEFSGVAEGDVGASGEDGVQRVASGVCWGSDELSESKSGEVGD